MSGTPQVRTPVELAMIAQSGRFEFFKQALTLGLALSAGMAAVFTGAVTIPSAPWMKALAIISGILLAGTTVSSIMGISTYANLLKALHSSEDTALFERGMVNHARLAFCFGAFAAIALVVFAVLRIIAGNPAAPDQALRLARRVITAATAANPTAIKMGEMTVGDRDIIITYLVGPEPTKFTLRLDRRTNELESVTRVEMPEQAKPHEP